MLSRLPSIAPWAALTLAVSIALSLAPSTPARAAQIWIYGDPAPAGAITFGPTGALSGHVPVNIVAPVAGFGPAPTFPIFDGVLSFATGRGDGGNPARNLFFRNGGNLSITGSFNGGPQETILSSEVDHLGGGTLINMGPAEGGSLWRLSVPALFIATLAEDIRVAYALGGAGTPAWSGGTMDSASFFISFVGTPGGVSAAGAQVSVELDATPFATPEPGSAVLMGVAGVGVGMVGWWRRWRARRGRAA